MSHRQHKRENVSSRLNPPVVPQSTLGNSASAIVIGVIVVLGGIALVSFFADTIRGKGPVEQNQEVKP